MKVRLFAALEIPKDILEQLIEIRKSLYDDKKIKWEGIDKLHITIKFFGDVFENQIEQINKNLNYITKNYLRIPGAFTNFGLFYRNNHPAILWAGIEATQEIVSLHKKINNSMYKLGFKKEVRNFKPHLTLLRLKGKEDISKIYKFKNYKIDINNFYFRSIKLFKSELTRAGSIYSVIDEFTFRED